MCLEGGEGDMFGTEVVDQSTREKAGGPDPECCFGVLECGRHGFGISGTIDVVLLCG